MGELRDRVLAIQAKVEHFSSVIKVPQKLEEINRLEARMADSAFWNDQQAAQAAMSTLKSIKTVIDPYLAMDRQVKDTVELLDMAEDEGDEGTLADISAEADRMAAEYDKLELRLALSGKYDRNNVYLTIKPGAGGVESCDWGEMLVRMYTNFCRRIGWSCDVMEMLPGEQAGLKVCTLAIKGDNAYGYLKSEMGTHRLVRISPFDANARRQTSFTAVEVTPELEDVGEVEIDEKELRIDTFKASGAGGQHVNKTESAIRITHIPSGIFATCQSERSQPQNKSIAMKMLAARLQQVRESERLDELKDLKGERGTIGWGYQIRSYVMMPYQMVKDLRTGHETSQIQGVLDGDLEPFMDAYLRWQLAGRPDRKAQDKDD